MRDIQKMKKKKIILYYANLEEQKDYHWLPTNQLFLAAWMMDKGYEVKIIDGRVEENAQDILKEEAKDSVLVCFSVLTGYQIISALKATKMIRELYPSIPIIWGGSHPSALPRQTLENENIDIVVRDQGEETIFELAEGFYNDNVDLPSIKGIGFKQNGEIVLTPKRDLFDINRLPKLPFHLLKIERYINPDTKALNYTASIGCTGNCTFCYWGGRHDWMGFDAKRVLDDIEWLVKEYGLEIIRFSDSNFFVDEKWVQDIARGIIERGLNIKYNINARVDEFSKYSKETLDLLRDSGLNSVFIGLESGSPRMLKLMNKKINLDDMEEIARFSINYPFKIFLSLIFMIPTEEIKDMEITKEYMDKIKSINPRISCQTCIYNPLPKVYLTTLAEKHGYKVPSSLEAWGKVIKTDRFEYKTWFSKEFNEEFRKRFHELFPQTDGYGTQVVEKS